MSNEMSLTKIAVFKGKKIRKTIHNNEWWFSVVDVAQVLTDQEDDKKARKYWNKLAQRLKEEGSELVTFCHQLKLPASDGKLYETDCANTEGIFRGRCGRWTVHRQWIGRLNEVLGVSILSGLSPSFKTPENKKLR